MVSLLLMLGNQVRQMDQKPPVTLALVAGEASFPIAYETSISMCLKHVMWCAAVQVLLFAAPQEIASFIPTISNACLHPYKVLEVSTAGNYMKPLSVMQHTLCSAATWITSSVMLGCAAIGGVQDLLVSISTCR